MRGLDAKKARVKYIHLIFVFSTQKHAFEEFFYNLLEIILLI